MQPSYSSRASPVSRSLASPTRRWPQPSAETAAPEDVMQLLQEYYDAAGEAVTESGGTIQNFAGDGILTLVGAPIPYADHAQRAVIMALKMRERGEHVLSRWQKLRLDVGLGIGLASGYVTVGAIGGERRLEYVAVGPPVNLAARPAPSPNRVRFSPTNGPWD
jgi:adenylate cyclase